MKKICLLLSLIAFSIASIAQKLAISNVPINVKVAFTKSHPTVTNVSWTKSGANYKVDFTLNANQKQLMYGANGILVFNEVTIALNTLPEGVRQYLEAHYPKRQLDKILKMTTLTNKVTYSVAIDSISLIFDDKGSFLKIEK